MWVKHSDTHSDMSTYTNPFKKAILSSVESRKCDWLLCVFTRCLSLLSPNLSIASITSSLLVSFSLSFFWRNLSFTHKKIDDGFRFIRLRHTLLHTCTYIPCIIFWICDLKPIRYNYFRFLSILDISFIFGESVQAVGFDASVYDSDSKNFYIMAVDRDIHYKNIHNCCYL